MKQNSIKWIVAATPIDPPENDLYWAFHFINNSTEQVESVVVEAVWYEWGDSATTSAMESTFGPIAPGKSVEIWKETATEVRTSLVLSVRSPSCVRRISAEVGRLYSHSGAVVPIPVLNRPGKLATIETLASPPGTVEIDALGVRRWLSEGKCESIQWDRLVKVEIMTTDDGPFSEDVFWVLREPDRGCVIPSGIPEAEVLTEKLQALPGFDNQAMISAMGSTENARFVVWQKRRLSIILAALKRAINKRL